MCALTQWKIVISYVIWQFPGTDKPARTDRGGKIITGRKLCECDRSCCFHAEHPDTDR